MAAAVPVPVAQTIHLPQGDKLQLPRLWLRDMSSRGNLKSPAKFAPQTSGSWISVGEVSEFDYIFMHLFISLERWRVFLKSMR